MFDASFKELLLILVLGLLVLGPERLPKVAAEIGKWVARARRTAMQLRRQLEREIELDDAIQSRRERERREAAQRAAEATSDEGTAARTAAASTEHAESAEAGVDPESLAQEPEPVTAEQEQTETKAADRAAHEEPP